MHRPGRPRRGAEAGLEDEVDVVIGTLGKALGSYGAFAACDHAHGAAAGQHGAAVHLLDGAAAAGGGRRAGRARPARRAARSASTRLQANADALRDELAREGFDVSGSTTQIVPLVVGEAALAMRICELALERGVFAQAIRPPTVPEGTSRLRLAVMASHTREELREAARVLGRAALQAGFRPGAGVPAVAARAGLAADARPFDAETDIPRAA